MAPRRRANSFCRMLTLAALAAWHGSAAAHAAGTVDATVNATTFALVIFPLGVSVSLYLAGLLKRTKAAPLQGRHLGRGVSFAAGTVLLFAALVWPLEAWTASSFAAHMVQHMVLVLLAPPLLLLARPGALWLRGLPAGWRKAAVRWRKWPGVRGLSLLSASPVNASLLYGAALWFWHVPVFFDMALQSDLVHWAEHLTLIGTSLLFWRSLMRARRAGAAWGLVCSLVTVIHSSFLGALLTLAPRPLYPVYALARGTESALADQQMAGLIMWVPMGAAYLLVGLFMAHRSLAPQRAT